MQITPKVDRNIFIKQPENYGNLLNMVWEQ